MCPYWLGFSEIRVKIHVPDDFQTAATTEHFTDGCHQTAGHTTAYALNCALEWLHLYAARTAKLGAASGGNSQSCKHLWHCRLAWGSLPCPCPCKMFCQSRLSGQSFPGVSALPVHGAKGWRDIRESLYSKSCGIFFRQATEPGLAISDLSFQELLWTNKKPLAFLHLCHSLKTGYRSSVSITWNEFISLMLSGVHRTLISAGVYRHPSVTCWIMNM